MFNHPTTILLYYFSIPLARSCYGYDSIHYISKVLMVPNTAMQIYLLNKQVLKSCIPFFYGKHHGQLDNEDENSVHNVMSAGIYSGINC